MIRRPPRSTRVRSSAASDVYKRQDIWISEQLCIIFVKRIVHSLGSSAQVSYLHETVCDILKKWIVKKYCHKKKRRKQKYPGRLFIFINVHSNTPLSYKRAGSIHAHLEVLVIHGNLMEGKFLSLIHISEPTRPLYISYAVFCLKKFFF